MTIEEAINHAKEVFQQKSEKSEHVIGLFNDSDCKECAKQHEQLAKWLKELQQYRAIGTIDYINEAILLTKADEILLSQYKAIGAVEEVEVAMLRLKVLDKFEEVCTLDECQEAMERRTPKKPHIWGDGYDNEGNMIYDMYDCPNCGKSYEIDYQDYKHCPECGQAIDWSEKKN